MNEQVSKEFAALANEEVEQQQREIAPGLTVEQMKALFFDAASLREPAYRLYRLDGEGHRYYYRFEDGQPVFYPSITTLLQMTMPTSPFLIDWIVANGKEGAAEKRDLAAAYGTLMHWQFEVLLINRTYDFDAVPAIIQDYLNRENLPDKVFGEWCVRLRKDILAFIQFVRDYNVRPLAIEISLASPTYHFAGTLDMPCVMTDPKTRQDFTAIVDFKSGRKGFWEEHELQLHLCKMAWDENFPEIPIQRLFNFAPKDWRKSPTYNLEDQTGSKNAEKLPYLLALAAIEDEKRENTVTVIRGKFDLGGGDYSENLTILSLSELIAQRADEAENPAEGEIKPEKAALSDEVVNTPAEPIKAPQKEKSKKLTLLEQEVEI